MRLSFALVMALLLFSSLSFASFNFLYSMNGNKSDDIGNYFLFSQPTGLLYQDGKLYVADAGRGAIYIFNGINREYVKFDPPSENILGSPQRMISADGIFYIAGGSSGNIISYKGMGYPFERWNQGNNMQKTSGIASDNGYLYATDMVKGQVLIYSQGTRSYSSIGIDKGGSDGLLDSPADILLHDGKFYVADAGKGMIFVYSKNLTYLYSMGRGRGGVTLSSPHGIEIYQDRIYVADYGAGRVVAFSMDGYPLDVLDSSVFEGNFTYPEDVAVADGKLYVADTFNKQVKVFQINQSAGDPAVLAKIGEANASLSRLLSLQSLAQKIKVDCPQDSLQSDLLTAQQYYDDLQYSPAASLAQGVIDSSNAKYANLSQQVNLKIRQAVKAEQDRVAPYRTLQLGNLSLQIIQFDNKASDISMKLDAGSYSSAATSTVALHGFVNGFISSFETQASVEEESKQTLSSSAMDAKIVAAESRLSALSAKAAAYRQELNLSDAGDMLKLARSAISSGDYPSANYSLSLAIISMDAGELELAAKSPAIDVALSNITLMEFEINATIAKPSIIPADVSQERQMLASAKETAYGNPDLGVIMAAKARDSATAKISQSRTFSLVLASVVSMVVLMGLVAAAFYLYIANKKKDGAGHSHGKKGVL